MSFTLEEIKNGKDIMLYENNKYRESYPVKTGEIVWRCLGKNCKASVRTNKEKTVIHSSNGVHSGPHPMTMRALLSSAQAKRGCRSPSTTPTRLNDISFQAVPSTPDANTASETMTTSAHQGSPAIAEPMDVHLTLRAENAALKEELVKLRVERQAVLDHSIESDQRLLQYTQEIFTPPPSMSKNSAQGEIKLAKEELEKALSKIKELEERIRLLMNPCEICAILKEETKNMVQSLRCLEAENKQLKDSILPHDPANHTPLSIPIPVHNSFQALKEDLSMPEDTFITAKKRRKRNKAKAFGMAKTSTNNNNNKNGSEIFLSTPFPTVTVVGDSHVRNVASLIRSKLRVGTKISGFCKPGAGLLGVRPTSITPHNHCYVLMAGTNDVDAGREDVIFNHLEDIIIDLKKTSRVLVLPLTTRYDLRPTSSIHHTVGLVNDYITKLCTRHRGVEMVDISTIRRHHYTAHGLHLNARGKEVLANTVAMRLANMCPLPQTRRLQIRPAHVRAAKLNSAPPAACGITRPGIKTFAEAVTSSPTVSHSPVVLDNHKYVFLGTPLSNNGQN